ncbi:MAG: crotonase/enoyl-CoA hydratase family protein [Myxococcota bacterium]
MSEQSTVSTETRGHVFLIGLNRPDKLNAFNPAMLGDLARAYTEYEDSRDLWCAVLFAHGKGFTSGLDLAQVGPAVAGGQTLFPEGGVDPLGIPGGHDGRFRQRSKPIICAVHGWCLTIGMELIMASDMCVAADDTRFSQLEVGRGIMPFGGATLRFHQLAGWGNAMRYLLTGDRFDAAEAYRIGLVQEVTEPGQQLERAIALAERVAAQAPLAVQATLASAMTTRERGAEAAVATMMDQTRELMKSEDAMEGVRSFIERRDAVFKGR